MKYLLTVVGFVNLLMFMLIQDNTYLVSANVLFVGSILYDKLEDIQNERN